MARTAKPKLITIYPTVAEIYSAFMVLEELSTGVLYGKLSMKIRRLKREIKPLAAEFQEERNIMLEASGVKDGEDWKTKDGYFVWKTKKAEKLFDELKDALQPVTIIPLVEEDFDRDDVNVAEKALDVLEECQFFFEAMPEKSPAKPKIEKKAESKKDG
jgi:hypothetical protein